MGSLEPAENNEKVVILEKTHQPVSLKIYQDIYYQITGRTEQISKKYSNNLIIDFYDLEQINYKIKQVYDTHNIHISKETITFLYDNDRQERFTSFDRCKLYNANNNNSTIAIELQYHFCKIVDSLDSTDSKTQEYTITISLTSRIGLLNSLEKNGLNSYQRRFLNGFGLSKYVAEIKIDYIDYIVARTFIEAFDEWVKGCKEYPSNNFFIFLQKWSHYFSVTIKIFLSFILVFCSWHMIPDYFNNQNTSLDILAQFLVFYSGSLFIITKIGAILGSFLENIVDSFVDYSYLKLNKGDEKLIDIFLKKRNRKIKRFIFNTLFLIGLGILTSKLSLLF